MPDWSYRTVFRPVLFRLPPATARDLALGAMGLLARLPLGSRIIDFLGHMRPPQGLSRQVLGITFPTAVGIGAELDANAVALPALARFGVGFLEVGPVTADPVQPAAAIELRTELQAIGIPDPPLGRGLAALARCLERAGPLGVPLIVRLGCAPGASAQQATMECVQAIQRLAPLADLFTLATATHLLNRHWTSEEWDGHLRAAWQAVQAATPPRLLLVGLPPDCDAVSADRITGPALELGVAGVAVIGGVRGDTRGRLIGEPAFQSALALVQHLRDRWGDGPALIAAGGIHEPVDALDLLDAGANLVQVESGLVYSGPGLPKRINDAVLFAAGPVSAEATARAAEMSWFWTLLLAVAMLLGGGLALVIASTRVVLHYDEEFVAMSRSQLEAVNDRLLAFMAHDRVTLAGTMIAVGALYFALSVYGIRRGQHWAWVALLASAFSGFGSFFLFLGFGYFDPFHAFVTAILFQFLLLALHARLPARADPTPPVLRTDWRWRLGQWGQLLFVIHGAVLVVAGAVIASVGCTTVFVHEDLEFMRTTRDALATANPRLLPLIAHDRASFGGMLIACGIAVELSSLWGFRAGAGWLWWALLLAGVGGYGPAVGVHLAVGYTDLWHLAPAFGGVVVLVLGLGLLYPWMCQGRAELERAWMNRKSGAR